MPPPVVGGGRVSSGSVFYVGHLAILGDMADLREMEFLHNLRLDEKKNGSQPKYVQLKSRLLEELRTGRLKPGQALPSEGVIADQLQMARSTVRQAFAELQRDGILHRV